MQPNAGESLGSFLDRFDKSLESSISLLNHISGCGHDTNVLKDRIFEYIANHGPVGAWHSFNDVCKGTFAWEQFGKRVVDPLILLLVGAGEIEVDALPNPRQIRVKF
jgi:hypothetical protein